MVYAEIGFKNVVKIRKIDRYSEVENYSKGNLLKSQRYLAALDFV